jgi:hypothetical protein
MTADCATAHASQCGRQPAGETSFQVAAVDATERVASPMCRFDTTAMLRVGVSRRRLACRRCAPFAPCAGRTDAWAAYHGVTLDAGILRRRHDAPTRKATASCDEVAGSGTGVPFLARLQRPRFGGPGKNRKTTRHRGGVRFTRADDSRRQSVRRRSRGGRCSRLVEHNGCPIGCQSARA